MCQSNKVKTDLYLQRSRVTKLSCWSEYGCKNIRLWVVTWHLCSRLLQDADQVPGPTQMDAAREHLLWQVLRWVWCVELWSAAVGGLQLRTTGRITFQMVQTCHNARSSQTKLNLCLSVCITIPEYNTASVQHFQLELWPRIFKLNNVAAGLDSIQNDLLYCCISAETSE